MDNKLYMNLKIVYTSAKKVINMYDRCPGQSMRNLRSVIKKCWNCGGEVEMFSDEERVRCKKCRNFVYKYQLPYCIQGYLDAVLIAKEGELNST